MNRAPIVHELCAEVLEVCDSLEQSVLYLERQPGDVETIAEAVRHAHTVKGNALMMGFEGLTEVARTIEAAFAALLDGRLVVTATLVGWILDLIDAIRALVPGLAEDRDEVGAGPRQVMARVTECIDQATSRGEPAARTAESASIERADPPRWLRVDRVRVERLDDLVTEIVIARTQLAQRLEAVRGNQPLRDAFFEHDRLFVELQERASELRLVPLGALMHRFTRGVRDLAHACGKQVELHVEGGDIEVDVSIVDHLRAPLTHVIRNAVAHGIETPDVRRAAGKPEGGIVTVRAERDGSGLLVEVYDDGAGIDRAKVAARGQRLGLIAAGVELDPQQVEELLFRPGFSTADSVSDIAGRGIGMDVVRRKVEALRGSVTLSSAPGQGTTVEMRVPINVAVIAGFRIRVAGEPFVIPMDDVVECAELAAQPSTQLERDGKPLPFLRLRDAFGLDGAAPPRESLVVVRHAAGAVGLAVDELDGEAQVAIKPLAAIFRGVRAVSGAAILGNGRVALVLDVDGVVATGRAAGAVAPAAPRQEEA